jgi:hypothetical protein
MPEKHYIKLDLDINLEPYSNALLNRKVDNPYPKSQPIKRDELLAIVPELKEFNNILISKGYIIYGSSTMVIEPGIFGGLHVDGDHSNGIIHDLKLNIPILNGPHVSTRWYDLSGLKYDKINWEYNRSNFTAGDEWFFTNKDMLVNERCVSVLKLNCPTIINSGIPHNVDATESKVPRSVLSMNILDLSTDYFTPWSNRQVVLDAVMEYSANLSKTC